MARAGSTSRPTAEGPDAANPTLIRSSRGSATSFDDRMSLLPFLFLTGLGTIAVVALRSRPRIATPVGVAALFLAVVAAALIRPSQSIGIGTSGIATTEYLRIFLLLAALATLLLAIVAEATEDRGDA